jgi:hypothetical protein
MSFDYKEPTSSIRRRGFLAAVRKFGEELADVSGYWVGLFALIGIWRLFPQLKRPVDNFALLLLALYAAAVLVFATREGYLEARHLLPWLVIGIGSAGYGTLAIGRCLGKWCAGSSPRENPHQPHNRGAWSRSRSAWATVLIAGVACLLDLTWPLNDSQIAHRQAGEWLAEQCGTQGLVLDTRGWTGLYSGRTTSGYHHAKAAFGDPRLAFVVLEPQELAFSSRRARTLRALIAAAGTHAGTFPTEDERTPDRRIVVVYRWLPERFVASAGGSALTTGRPSPRVSRTPLVEEIR